MSNVTLFNASNVPAFARNNELSDTAKALTGGGTGVSTKRISIKGGVFRLLAGGKEVAAIDDRHLDVIIVKAAPKVNRIFYAKSYDADNIAGPDCWSNDGETPDASIKTPQHSACHNCPQNIAGSGQGNSRACRFQQRLAVVLANDPEGDVLQLTLPATSIFGKEDGDKRPLKAYAQWLAAQNVDPTDVVTRLKFDTSSESPKLHFKAMRFLSDGEYETCQDQAKSGDALKAITMTVAKMDNVPKIAAPLEGTPPRAKAKAAAEDDEAPPPPPKKTAKAKAEPVEEADEPVVRKEEKKPNAVPAAKANLASMVDDWDDE